MSNIVHKVKEAISGHTSHSNDPTTSSTTNHGHHNTNVGNKADPRIDSDLDGRSGLGNNHSSSTTTAGPHSSDIANKLDPRVDSDRDGSKGLGTTGTSTHTGTHAGTGLGSTGLGSTTGSHNTSGPHGSDLLNKADPRVDSDRDGSRNYGAASGTTGTHAHTGLGGTTGTHTGTGLGSSTTGSHNTAGPHSNDLLNKVDPRVDSDRDGSRNFGAASGTTGTHASTGLGGTHTGLGGTHTGTHAGTGLGSTGLGTSHNTAGPHDSNLLNKADPRVDSDRDGSHNYGAATGATGASAYGSTGYTGAHSGSHAAGPHDSNLLNKADPRVDSDRDGSRNYGAATGATGASAYSSTGATHGTHGTHGTTGLTGTHGAHHAGPGPAPNTAGPHGNDMLNKVDPRVDSDLDGSKTVGGNKTYAA